MAAPGDLVLGIDTGFDRLGLCLVRVGHDRFLVSESTLGTGALTASLRRLTRRAPGKLAAVAVGVGPGKFSAIRTGMAFAMGLARADGARLYGLSLFQMLAEAVSGESGRLLLCSSGGGRIRYGQYGHVSEQGWVADAAPIAIEPGVLPAGANAWIDPRDLARPLGQPAAQLAARLGLGMVSRGAPDESGVLRPLYVSRPSLGPAPDRRPRAAAGEA